jgi:hypothetical protein
MLDYFLLKNFSKPVTVGECLGDPPENWYRAAGGAPNASLLVSYRMIKQRLVHLANKLQLHKKKSDSSTLRHSATLQCSVLLLVFAHYIASIFM